MCLQMNKPKPEKIACTGCGEKYTEQELGRRRDDRLNTRCRRCRAGQASTAGRIGHRKATTEPALDTKALRVVERYIGYCLAKMAKQRGRSKPLPWKEWVTPAGRVAEQAFYDRYRQRFEWLWSDRLARIAGRRDAMRAARDRIEARRILAGDTSTPIAEPVNLPANSTQLDLGFAA